MREEDKNLEEQKSQPYPLAQEEGAMLRRGKATNRLTSALQWSGRGPACGSG